MRGRESDNNQDSRYFDRIEYVHRAASRYTVKKGVMKSILYHPLSLLQITIRVMRVVTINDHLVVAPLII